MDQDITDFLRGKTVFEVDHCQDHQIIISFHSTLDVLILDAQADCCSESWFETLSEEFDVIVDREIATIITEGDIDLPASNRQKCDENKIVVITFSDESTFQFVLRNSSNGYYSGWLDMRIQKNDPSPVSNNISNNVLKLQDYSIKQLTLAYPVGTIGSTGSTNASGCTGTKGTDELVGRTMTPDMVQLSMKPCEDVTNNIDIKVLFKSITFGQFIDNYEEKRYTYLKSLYNESITLYEILETCIWSQEHFVNNFDYPQKLLAALFWQNMFSNSRYYKFDNDSKFHQTLLTIYNN